MHDFLDAIWQGRQVPLDIWKSLDMTLPGILSVTTLSRQDAWVEVPDPRSWSWPDLL